jgi:diguanylate cyclase (GGDEF)-like protein/PAS domain S-box-containing protein
MIQKAVDYQFTDLVDIDAFREMLTSFYEATGILHGLVDANNNIISAVGWQEACTQFHRVNPVSRARCEASNQKLAAQLGGVGFVGGVCLNGLMDYACPIVIEGKQMATLYFGQILHEPPEMAFFQRQALEYGYDEEAYLEAISKVPVIPHERVEPIMTFFTQLAQTLARSGLDRMYTLKTKRQLAELNQELSLRVKHRTEELAEKNQQLATDIAKRQETEAALRDNQAQLQAILDSSPIGIGWAKHSKVEYVNKKFTELTGYQKEDITTVDQLCQLVFPDETLRREILESWSQEVMRAKHTGLATPVLEAPIVCQNGTVRYGMITVSWVGERSLVNFSDITDRWHAEQRNQARNKILELIAKGAPLKDTLNVLVQSVEQENHDTLCSILLLDKKGKHLYTYAAPSLPDFYNQAVDGVEIGPNVGSCGTAAYCQKRVVTSDIQSHPYWTNSYRDLATQAGLVSCWSEPIFSSQGRLLGTFAIYHRQPKEPEEDDLHWIGQAANLASIAIEHHQTLNELEYRAHTDSLTGLANRGRFMELADREITRAVRYQHPYAALILDIDHFKMINDRFGHKSGDTVLQTLATILKGALRENDIIGRIGGEEFAVLLPETDAEKASEVAERLRLTVADTKITTENVNQLTITVSIGLAIPRDFSLNIDNILSNADSALYGAKNSGRNRVCNASETGKP